MKYPIRPISEDFKELELSDKAKFPTIQEFISKWCDLKGTKANTEHSAPPKASPKNEKK